MTAEEKQLEDYTITD
jgi:hypothetical protein